jgi:hypothetical protein
MNTTTSKPYLEEIEAFIALHKRCPRILHLGNIANNGFNNAKLLNQSGFDCDVLCFDFYHIMGSPEWEELPASAQIDTLNHNNPDWGKISNESNYSRPDWFAQGTLNQCLDYLIARRCGNVADASAIWLQMGKTAKFSTHAHLCQLAAERIGKVHSFDGSSLSTQLAACLVNGELQEEDVAPFKSCFQTFNELFNYYDFVHAYGLDGFLPLMTGHPYIAYEHGTIRTMPFEDSPTGRRAKVTYLKANHVFITNPDNFQDARKALHLEGNSTFIPHPIKDIESGLFESGLNLRKQLLHKLNADFLIFLPSRQHWVFNRHINGVKNDLNWDKGSDIFIRGFFRFLNSVNPNAACIATNWGYSLKESKHLIYSLGIENRFQWIEVQHNSSMMHYIQATDVLADQFVIGSIGGTPAKAFACGRLVLSKLEPNVLTGCFSAMPPILNCETPEDVEYWLTKCYLEPRWVEQIASKGAQWFEIEHSNKRVLAILQTVYAKLLKNRD